MVVLAVREQDAKYGAKSATCVVSGRISQRVTTPKHYQLEEYAKL